MSCHIKVEMGLQASEPLWVTQGPAAFLSKENGRDQNDAEALHKSVAAKQPGQTQEDEDEIAAAKRTLAAEAVARSQADDVNQCLRLMVKQERASTAHLLSIIRGITYSQAKRMVHRRDQYEAEGRLAELSPKSVFEDPLMDRLPDTPARKKVKNQKPTAKAYLERKHARDNWQHRASQSSSWN